MSIAKYVLSELVANGIIISTEDVQSFTLNPPVPYDTYDCSVRVRSRNLIFCKEINGVVIASYTVIGNYINIMLDRKVFVDMIANYFTKKEYLSGFKAFYDQKWAVEHTSITPVYPINIATFRSSVIGDSIKRLIEVFGGVASSHFFVEDMARQIELLEEGIYLSGIDVDCLEPNEKIDHLFGRIFTTAYVQRKPSSRAVQTLKKMFPLSRTVKMNRTDPPIIENTLQRKELCQLFLKGVTKTLSKANILIDSFDYESECMSDFEATDFNNYEVVQAILSGSSKIPYYLRNCAYFINMGKKYDKFITVISDRQRSVITDTFDALTCPRKLQAVFFGDVLITDSNGQNTLDSIKEGVFHSVDSYIDSMSIKCRVSKAHLTKALKLKILSSKLYQGCYINCNEHKQYSREIELIKYGEELEQKNEKEISNSDLTNLSDEKVWRLVKKLCQFENVLSKTSQEFDFSFLSNYISDVYDCIKAADHESVKASKLHRIICSVFFVTFKILGID